MGARNGTQRKAQVMQLLGYGQVDKFDLIEIMIINSQISLERAEELIKAHPDEVESEWLDTIKLEGAFYAFGQVWSVS